MEIKNIRLNPIEKNSYIVYNRSSAYIDYVDINETSPKIDIEKE